MRKTTTLALTLFLIASAFGLAQAQIKINEVMINDYSTDDSSYVELYGPAGTDLTGYTLVGVNGYNGADYQSITLTGSIPADGFFVIGQTANVANVDQISTNVNYQNGPDNIQLRQGTTVIDAIGYGTFVSPDTFFAGEGSPCLNQVNGQSLSRYPDGNDTNDNSVDFTLTPMLTPGTANSLGAPPPFYTLSYIRTNQATLLGQIVQTKGIASCASNLFGGTGSMSAYLQDTQAGVNLFGGSYTFVAGDCVLVTGTVAQYQNLLEITPIQQLTVGPNVPVPAPILLTCATANSSGETYESMLISLSSVWIITDSIAWPDSGFDANLNITDASGDTLVLRIDKDTNLDGWAGHPIPGQQFNLIAILNQFGATYQALPRSQADFTIIPPILDVTMTPINPPIIVPAQGGTFQFNAAVLRTAAPQNPFWVWARIKNPDGSYTNPTVGPVQINPPVGIQVSRNRTQNVPSTWAAGEYSYLGYANWTYTYPAVDSSSFTWSKSATATGNPTVWDAVCSGELFPGEVTVTAQPTVFSLGKATPNPFNPTAVISYQLPVNGWVSLQVYNTAGQLVATLVEGFRQAGQHQVTFEGSQLASGVYLYTLTANGSALTGKMMLVK